MGFAQSKGIGNAKASRVKCSTLFMLTMCDSDHRERKGKVLWCQRVLPTAYSQAKANNFRKDGLPTVTDHFSEIPKSRYKDFGIFMFFMKLVGFGLKRVHGSIWVHIKTEKSHTAQNDF